MTSHRVPLARLAVALFAVGLLAVFLTPSTHGEATRAQQIAEIEKQIKDLTQKLEELKKLESAQPQAGPPKVEGTIPAGWVGQLHWRSIGPATMSGRITAISVFEADPSTYWVATASGGLLKTTNNGVTFEHQFDREATVSVGAVAVAQADRNVVWVGTGENNPRNSVSWGDGVYKSTDGGKSWKNMGLKSTFQIGKIAIHPRDPNIVYVGALGRLYGPSKERGVYKTTDAGEHWEQVLFLDENTGIIDVQINPADPETVLVAGWERKRDGFDSHPGREPIEDGYDGYDPIKKWGKKGGIYKTIDAGKHWRKLDAGLPTVATGRIGLDYYRKDPKTVFAIIDTEKIGMGTPPPPQAFLGARSRDADGGGAKIGNVVQQSSAAKAGLQVNDVIVAIDKKEVKTARQVDEIVGTHKVGDKLVFSILRDNEKKDVTVTLEPQPEPNRGVYVGFQGEEGDNGVKVTEVGEKGPADKAGLKTDDVIKAIDKKPVKTLREVTEQTRGKKAGDKLTLSVQRDKEMKDLVVTLEDRPGRRSATRPWAFAYGGQRENGQDQQGPNSHEYGGVYKSSDGGETWTRINSLNPRPMYFSQVRVDPTDDKYLYVCGISLYRSKDGGKTFTDDGAKGVHPDQHALWIDPRDGRHMIVGTDGGFYVTYDRMENWDHHNHMAMGQFYHVAVDTRKPYRVYGGLQDNSSWGGPSVSLAGSGPVNDDWMMVGTGDGFVCRVDPSDPDLVYWESQDGNIFRSNLKTGQTRGVGAPRSFNGPRYRFNWNTPFILSSHNPQIFYCAGEFVWRSVKQGENARIISPEITKTKRGSATALAESPKNPDVLWVGTDDGNLLVTRDGGQKWVNVQDKVGLPGPRWVATIEPSRFVEGRCYVCFDGHRSDDDEPHIYVTENFGETWKPIRANLPTGSTRCLREDTETGNLLYLGTEFAVWASVNRGESWTKINNNLPTVAVHEIAVHPTAGEIVAATHGRSLWILDVVALRQMTPSVMRAKANLFRPNNVVRWRNEPSKGSPIGGGARKFVGQNPPRNAQIFYALGEKAEKVSLQILDFQGKSVREWKAEAGPGMHRIEWDLTRFTLRGLVPGGGGPAGFFEPVTTGMYKLVLKVDDKEYTQSIRVDPDPTVPQDLIADEGEPAKEKRREDF